MKRNVFWINIAAMLLVVILTIFLTFRWISAYTQHGKAILVPDVTGIDESDAIAALHAKKLKGVPYDKTYVKDVPAGVVVGQRPDADAKVKRGRVVYLTLSSGNEPMVALPDIADNSSLRQA
ncbi:MAG: PASTA domain-containing protein, partial [Bacteroidaceae bacterium]|nr:PASTA domain-containing protein [Bacteroidaceae bacterium]